MLAIARRAYHRSQPPLGSHRAIGEMATGFPGYDSLMGPDTATIGEILKQNGWNTAWFGKNHPSR
jgi:arylsulfatase A-like enzyme